MARGRRSIANGTRRKMALRGGFMGSRYVEVDGAECRNGDQ